MRICMFAMLLPVHIAGGMEYHCMQVAKGIAEKGHDVTVITCKHPNGTKEDVVDNVRIIYTDSKATSRKPMDEISIKKMEELHRIEKFDLIHSQSFAAEKYVSKGYQKRLQIPFVTTMHGTLTNSIKSHLSGGLNIMLPTKIVFHIYNHFVNTKKMVEKSDAVIAVSEDLQKRIPKEFNVKTNDVKLIFNGVDTEKFKPNKKVSEKKIGCISVLHKQKGIQYLLKACEKIDDVEVTIVGDGGYKNTLEKVAKELNLKCTFKGNVNHADLPKILDECSVFCLPTISHEGLPLSLLEAMSSGLAVIATDIGGISSVIVDGVNGFLTKAKDVEGINIALNKLFESDEIMGEFGRNARKTILEKFSQEGMLNELINVYEGVLE